MLFYPSTQLNMNSNVPCPLTGGHQSTKPHHPSLNFPLACLKLSSSSSVSDIDPTFAIPAKRYARKKISTQGRIFELRPLDPPPLPPPILYVVVNSHALGEKFLHLAVHFQIFVFYFSMKYTCKREHTVAR